MASRKHDKSTWFWPRECLFWLCAAWTIAQMALITVEFFGCSAVRLPEKMPVYNFLLVAVYAAVKEAARWSHKRLGKKPGEYYFIAWWVFALILFLISSGVRRQLRVPDTTYANCWFVSIVYVASSISKIVHGLTSIEIHTERRNGVHRHVRL
ncbi:MAG: hypothetical protein V1778_02175 [bacterium]